MSEEEINQLINEVIRDEKNLGQYARNEIPLREFIEIGIKKGKLEAQGFNLKELTIILTCVKNELSFQEKDASSNEMCLRDDYVSEMINLIEKIKQLQKEISEEGKTR